MSIQHAAALAATLLTAGCAASGSWQGLAAEQTYDRDLEIQRLAEVNNNDDYFEVHREGRIYVLSDAKEYRQWLAVGEIPLVVTRIGAGPRGETVKLALTKKEAKAMEAKVGSQGAAQKMFEGTLAGLEKGFYGQVQPASGEIYVFSRWEDVVAFRKQGSASGQTVASAGPNGEAVTFVGPDVTGAQARFKAVHAGP